MCASVCLCVAVSAKVGVLPKIQLSLELMNIWKWCKGETQQCVSAPVSIITAKAALVSDRCSCCHGPKHISDGWMDSQPCLSINYG